MIIYTWETANEAILNTDTLESLESLERSILDNDSSFNLEDLTLTLGALDNKINLSWATNDPTRKGAK